MYSLYYGKSFLSSIEKLDSKIQLKIQTKLAVLQQDPHHSTLHTKPLQGTLAGFYSFRVGRDYRVIFQFLEEKKILLLSAKPRGSVYN